MPSMYFVSQTLSKKNILQKLDKDLWDYIEDIREKEKKAAALIIQYYNKKYIHINVIPNLLHYIIDVVSCNDMTYESFYKNIERFDKLFNKKKLSLNKAFNTITKCECCELHIHCNNMLRDKGFYNYDIIIELPEVFKEDCLCYCSNAALFCMECETTSDNYFRDMESAQ